MAVGSSHQPVRWPFNLPNKLLITTVIAALCVALPILVVISFVITGISDAWSHLFDTLLGRYALNSLMLSVLVAIGVVILGVPAAWIISFYRFKGRGILSWLLLLPMAYPAYILAYTYTGVLDFSGPILTFLRDAGAPHWLMSPLLNIRSLPGAALMLSLVLYPYVYLLARAAFMEQSANLMEAAYTLGQGRWRVLTRIVIPMARPAIAAGILLAVMETLADFGTVQFFGVQTFTTGIVRTYYGFGDPVGAAQLSALLISCVFLLVAFEKASRSKVRYYSDRLRKLNETSVALTGWRQTVAQILCILPVFFGFLLPTGILSYWALLFAELQSMWSLIVSSFFLAGFASIFIVSVALLICYANRLYPSQWLNHTTTFVGLGYALPGVVVAIGVLIPFGAIDRLISNALAPFGIAPSLWLSGTLVALVFAYLVRFLTVATGNLTSGLSRIRPSIDQSGRLLGLDQFGVISKLHVPLIRGSVFTAILVCFVDILKELPATLILRPFDFNTLAVKAYELAGDERLIDASVPSILIVLVGLVPVIWLNRSVTQE
ncbi:iron ABC transporter permease [Litorivicinus sp.]|nr:iron ABC transporter permease [Litorivicinus sp.]